MKKTALGAAALSAALLLCGCATEYPAEAYENHPVSDALAQYVADNAGDTGSIQFDDEILQQTNLQFFDEEALRSALGDEAERRIGTARATSTASAPSRRTAGRSARPSCTSSAFATTCNLTRISPPTKIIFKSHPRCLRSNMK